MFSGRDDTVMKCVTISDLISVHGIIDIDLMIDKQGLPKRNVTYCKTCAICLGTLREDTTQSKTVQSSIYTLDNLDNQYDI